MEYTEHAALIDRLAEQYILADVSDPRGLADLHTEFERVTAWAAANAYRDLHEALTGASTMIERIVLAEVDNPQDRLAELTPLVEALALFARNGAMPAAWPCVREASDAEGASVGDEVAPTPPVPLSMVDDGLLNDFVAEALEHLEVADTQLLTLETDRDDAEALNAVFRAFHTIKGGAGFLQLADVLHVAHEAETLLDKARRHELALTAPVMDTVFESVDLLRVLVQALPGNARDDATVPGRIEDAIQTLRAVASGLTPMSSELVSDTVGPALGEILVGKRVVTAEDVDVALAQQQGEKRGIPIGTILVAQGKASAKDVAQALRQQSRETGGGERVREAIKVDAERLDRLVNLMGELVVAQAIMRQTVEMGSTITSATRHRLSQLDKTTRELQEISMSLRMVPLRSTFQKMARMVRDLAKGVGKPVEFLVQGEDTELDKSVVDLIGDPLMHMIRNAVDHGIEDTVQERLDAGKPEKGRVFLRAFHRGGSIFIEIEDDGHGLQREAILAKARERGLIEPDDVLTDREIWNLIFVPGFSTARTVTDVSGRGVGMDVVKRNIHMLRGQIELQSEPGKGTLVSIRLPLTLAIIDGMVVRVAEERYIVPTQSIVMAIRVKDHQLNTVTGRGEMVDLHGSLIPLFRLHRLLSVEDAEENASAVAVVVEADNKRVALLADELLGQQQTVIKSLGEGLRGLTGFAGGAIMADGNVGLILDVAGVVRLAEGGDSGRPPSLALSGAEAGAAEVQG